MVPRYPRATTALASTTWSASRTGDSVLPRTPGSDWLGACRVLPSPCSTTTSKSKRGWLGPLLRVLADDDRIGAVQPALLRHGTDLVNSLGVELDRFAAGSDRGLGTPAGTLGAPSAIDIFTGGAVLFRPEFLDETGGFDERYFLYYEDVDLALRGAEMGWTYRCETASVVRHLGGATTADLGDDRVRYQERNRLWTAIRFAPPTTIARAFWLSIRRLRHAPRDAHARALAGGLAGAPGALVRRVAARGRGRGAIVSADGG